MKESSLAGRLRQASSSSDSADSAGDAAAGGGGGGRTTSAKLHPPFVSPSLVLGAQGQPQHSLPRRSAAHEGEFDALFSVPCGRAVRDREGMVCGYVFPGFSAGQQRVFGQSHQARRVSAVQLSVANVSHVTICAMESANQSIARNVASVARGEDIVQTIEADVNDGNQEALLLEFPEPVSTQCIVCTLLGRQSFAVIRQFRFVPS